MKTLLVLLISVLVSNLTPYQTKIKGDLLIRNINIIDIKTGDIRYSRDIVISSDTISNIIKHNPKLKVEVAKTVDGSGNFLIPGLWDMHTHTWSNYKDFFPIQLANGVTGIREMFGNLEAVQRIRDEIKNGLIDGPIIVSSGAIIDGNPPTWGNSDKAETPDQGREFVRQQKQNGADFIKVYFNLKREVYLAISDECRKLNIPLVGHLSNRVPLDQAIKAGHKSFEHFYNILEFYSDQNGLSLIEESREGRFAGDRFYERLDYGNKTFDSTKSAAAIQLFKDRNVWICPTYTVHKGFMRDYDPAYTNDKRMAFMPPTIVARWMENKKKPLTQKQIEHWNSDKLWYGRVISESRKYKKAGVKFLAGTDSPNFFVYPGFSIHEELEIFVNEAGFTPMEALQTATINPAIFLNIEDKHGSVEVGKIANLVILDKNPLLNISNTRGIEGVVVLGKHKFKKEMKDVEIK